MSEAGQSDKADVLQQDVLASIFGGHLRPCDVLSCARVCRRWLLVAQADDVWSQLCQRQRAEPRMERYRLTSERSRTIAASLGFAGWRAEFERAERDSDRDWFLPGELSACRFVYRSRLTASDHDGHRSSFCFCVDGLVDGHPSGQRFPWRLDQSARSVVIGPEESPFRPLYASREPDWSWRLENNQVLLLEVDSGSERQWREREVHEPSEAACHPLTEEEEFVAVMHGAEVFYVDPSEAAYFQHMGATLCG